MDSICLIFDSEQYNAFVRPLHMSENQYTIHENENGEAMSKTKREITPH